MFLGKKPLNFFFSHIYVRYHEFAYWFTDLAISKPPTTRAVPNLVSCGGLVNSRYLDAVIFVPLYRITKC